MPAFATTTTVHVRGRWNMVFWNCDDTSLEILSPFRSVRVPQCWAALCLKGFED
jgi:hypothetical protein